MQFRKLFVRQTAEAPHLVLGRFGEDVAARYLERIGYSIRARNVHVGKDEIDIVAFDPSDRVLVFVEVKTRARYEEDFLPAANAGLKKWKRLHRGVTRYLHQKKFEGPSRFDLVSVVSGKVFDHVKEVGGWF